MSLHKNNLTDRLNKEFSNERERAFKALEKAKLQELEKKNSGHYEYIKVDKNTIKLSKK